MFSDHRLTIEDLLRNGKVPSPIQDGITPPSFTGNLRTLTAQLPLSERIARPERYEALRDARRNALEIFLKHPLDSGTLAAIGDLVMAILEEPTWVSPMHSLMDDDASPIIDFEVAETAVLLGWTLRIAGDSLKTVHPQLTRRTVLELRSRVFKPILQHARLPFIKGKGSAPIAICVDLVLPAMLAE
ncbi:MAG: hypothetical protein MJ099_05360, partial [Clostridia bacterium]|nr:hypothetical protein [Clostridia bacterium]